MTDVLPKPQPEALDNLLRARARALRAGDRPPASRMAWEQRRSQLRQALLSALGPAPEKPCPLQARVVATLKRDDYRIENLLFQSRPDVWVTASAYVPARVKGRVPAVLVVHGHWPW